MGIRSYELGRLKMSDKFKPRTVSLCDAALFSDFTGYIDEVLLEAPINVIDYPKDARVLDQLPSTENEIVTRLILSNGEIVMQKKVDPKSRFDRSKCSMILGYEAKIIGLLERHLNIIDLLGLAFDKNVPHLIFRNLSSLTYNGFLKKHYTINRTFLRFFVTELCDGLMYLHFKGVLHNMLTPTNILMRSSTSFLSPIIGNFSMACRIQSAKPFTIYQMKILGDCHYIRHDVRNGQKAPSLSSDIFSYGYLISHLQSRVPSSDETALQLLRDLVSSCLSNKGLQSIEKIVDDSCLVFEYN
jgi:serine/threonine protein kinase